MRTTRTSLVTRMLAVGLGTGLVLLASGCSDSGSSDATVDEWCTSIEEFDVVTNEIGWQNDPEMTAEVLDDMQGLVDNAPEEIKPAMDAWATSGRSSIEAIQVRATPDEVIASAGREATLEIIPYVETNCNGYEFGGSPPEEE